MTTPPKDADRQPAAKRSGFITRLLGAAALRPKIYEEIEADPGANLQAVAVVLLVSAAAGLGAGDASVTGTLVRSAVALASWTAWALLTVQVGGTFLPDTNTRIDLPESLRTLGFAASPGLILIAARGPVLGQAVFVVAGVWMLLAMIVAVRQALDYQRTSRAVVVCGVSALIVLGVTVAVGLLTASPAASSFPAG